MVVVRVYGIYINPAGEVLVTDEYQLGTFMTKFPGGGMEEGEGPLDCLKREFREEMGKDIRVLRHFYTTDFYQSTFLLPVPGQLLSIYYLVDIQDAQSLPVTLIKFDFPAEEGRQSFRLVPLELLRPDDFTFPIDRVVAGMLTEIDNSLHEKNAGY